MTKIRVDNTSGFRGVYWHAQSKRWGVRITVNAQRHYIGLFLCKIKAAKAYNQAVLRYLKEPSRLNQIETK